MKILYLVRHAKSSWKDMSLDDFDRPLNKRGKRDAPFIGEKLHEQGIIPDLMISSPAKRAKKTAEKIASELGYKAKEIDYKKGLFHASQSYLAKLLINLDNDYTSVMFFGHNPGLTDFSNFLTDEFIENIPTTGVVCIKFDLDSWKQIQSKSGKVIFFDYPKRYLEEPV